MAAEKVNGQWMVTLAEIERFIAERQVPQVVIACDVTFSAPKSLSILWASGSSEVRALGEDAFEVSVARGVAYLGANTVWVCRGQDSELASEMIAASYRHSTNRQLEPQLHKLVVIANMGTRPDDHIQALDGRSLFTHATTADYLTEAEMQHTCNRRGIANVERVGDEAIRRFRFQRGSRVGSSCQLGLPA